MVTTEKLCARCGEMFLRNPRYSRAQWKGAQFCSRDCQAIAMRDSAPLCACGCGERVASYSHRFLSGHRPLAETPRHVTPGGYVRLFQPRHPLANGDGYVLEHRLVLYGAGVEIPEGFHVHHRNGDKQDNRIENLEVLPAAEHHRRHLREQGYVVNQFGVWPLGSVA